MPALILYQGPACSIATIDADVERAGEGWRATFVARGALDRIHVPPLAQPGRQDDLWKTTCFEMFWQADGERDAYVEFNLSPSARWACYHFTRFRDGRTDAAADVAITCSRDGDELCMVADIRKALPTPAHVALNAVVEDADGQNRFWALRFAPGPVQFHAAECRVLGVPA